MGGGGGIIPNPRTEYAKRRNIYSAIKLWNTEIPNNIKECKSYEALMVFGVPQGSILGPLLFLIYINDIHEALKYSIARLFADDSNLLINNKCLKKIKKYLNFDLRFLSRWLRANKISLNAAKTELIIFRHPNKQLNYDLKVKIEGKKLYPSEFVKYLGVLIDCHLRWNYHIDFIAPKLSRALGMLTKVRNFVDSNTLRSVYFGIFSSIMFYGALVWGQLLNKHVNRILRLQDRAIRVLNFASYNDSRGPLYKKMRILKFTDYVYLQNFLFVHDSFEGKLPTVFNDYFMFSNKQHNYHTRAAANNHISLSRKRTMIYGIRSVTYQTAHVWNSILKENEEKDLSHKSKWVCKKYISNLILDSY